MGVFLSTGSRYQFISDLIHLQMLNNSRSVCGLSPEKLLQCATIDGARALSLSSSAGSLEVSHLPECPPYLLFLQVGKYFDAVSFSLDSPLLAHSLADTLVDSLVLSAGNREISHVFVAGVDRKT